VIPRDLQQQQQQQPPPSSPPRLAALLKEQPVSSYRRYVWILRMMHLLSDILMTLCLNIVI